MSRHERHGSAVRADNKAPVETIAPSATDWRDVRPAVVKNEDRVAARRGILAQIRRRRDLTQQEVAAHMGVSQARVSAIETKDMTTTELATLAKYVAALGGKLKLTAEFGDDRVVLDW